MTYTSRYQHQLRQINQLFKLSSEVFNNQRPIDRWLSDYFRKHSQFGSKDRKLISNSIFGYYRWYGWLKKIPDEETPLALLLGYLLDGNPVSGVVEFWATQVGIDSTTVNQIGKLSIEETCGLLKNCFISLSDISPNELNPVEVKHLSSHLIQSFQTRPKLWLRVVNGHLRSFTEFLSKKNILFQNHPEFSHSLALSSNINLFEVSAFRKGYIEVQDISSQGIGYVCDPKSGEIWWDVCAGSGGKALQLAALMEGQGNVYATEVYTPRLNEMKKRIKRNKKWSIIKPIFWDGLSNPCFDNPPDHILVDAPCSCSGTWRRSPDLRWHPQQSKIQQYRKIQLEILQLVHKVLPQGGKLVYATCSIFEEENLGVINEFLSVHPNFKLIPVNCPFTGNSFTNGISFNPPNPDGNSMYVAVLEKQ